LLLGRWLLLELLLGLLLLLLLLLLRLLQRLLQLSCKSATCCGKRWQQACNNKESNPEGYD
jgi:hypothetical protein